MAKRSGKRKEGGFLGFGWGPATRKKLADLIYPPTNQPPTTNLSDLLTWMRENRDADWTNLPTFGGPGHYGRDIWSWDSKNVIAGTHAGDLEIMSRADADWGRPLTSVRKRGK